jgi:hypothetical protein
MQRATRFLALVASLAYLGASEDANISKILYFSLLKLLSVSKDASNGKVWRFRDVVQ